MQINQKYWSVQEKNISNNFPVIDKGKPLKSYSIKKTIIKLDVDITDEAEYVFLIFAI